MNCLLEHNDISKLSHLIIGKALLGTCPSRFVVKAKKHYKILISNQSEGVVVDLSHQSRGDGVRRLDRVLTEVLQN